MRTSLRFLSIASIALTCSAAAVVDAIDYSRRCVGSLVSYGIAFVVSWVPSPNLVLEVRPMNVLRAKAVAFVATMRKRARPKLSPTWRICAST